MKYLVANWKCHKTSAEIKVWVEKWSIVGAPLQLNEVQIVLCPTLLGLPTLHTLLPSMSLGTQTLSPYGDGAYTGTVSARLAHEYADFAILGHAERRKYFAESDQQVALQVNQALDSEMTPIVAVSGQNWSSQLSQFDQHQLTQILVMYEPPEAISTNGSGQPAELAGVIKAAQLIKAEYPVKGVLYGGSVTAQNIATYFKEPTLAGVVVGAASLDPQEFAGLVKATR